MDLKKTARKLQRGLAAKGVRVRINQFQHFSAEKGKFLTKYDVIKEKNGPQKRNLTILSTYKMVEVVKVLAKLLEDTGGDEK